MSILGSVKRLRPVMPSWEQRWLRSSRVLLTGAVCACGKCGPFLAKEPKRCGVVPHGVQPPPPSPLYPW